MGSGIKSAVCFLTFCLVSAIGLSQNGASTGPLQPPNARRLISGSTTFAGYRLSNDARAILSDAGQALVRLPSVDRQAVPELLGILQQGGGVELFLGWYDAKGSAGDLHLEIFRGSRGADAALLHAFALESGPFGRVSFFQPPDARDTAKVLINASAGGTYSYTYLLAPDRQSVKMLFDSSDYQFADLDGDGIYELIAWDGRWSDPSWCLDLFSYALYPRIFVRDGDGYRMAWPPPVATAANFRVTAYADLRGDGASELLVLEDRAGGEPTTQALGIYRLEKGVFRLMAQAPLPADRIAFPEVDIRNATRGKEIVIRTAPPSVVRTRDAVGRCDPEGQGTGEIRYILRSDRLQPALP